MRTEKEKKRKTLNYRIISIILINIVFFVLLAVFGLNDETKDDFLMQSYFMNLDGASSMFHMWSNSLWSIMVYSLQKIIPNFCWHYLLQFLLVIVSLNMLILWVLKRIKTDECTLVLVSIVIAFYAYLSTIYKFNYTRTAGFVMSVGLLYIFGKEKTNVIIGLVLFAIGTIIRFNVIYISVGYIFVALLHEITNNEDKFAHRVIILLSLFFICLTMRQISRGIFGLHDEWVTLKEYNNAQSAVADYPIPDYESNILFYSNLGIKEIDYHMIKTRMADSDPSFFTSELLLSIANGKVSKKSFVTKNFFYELLLNLKNIICTMPLGLLATLALCFLLLFGDHRLSVFLNTLVTLAYIFLFTYLGRTVERVEICILFFSIVSLFLCSLKQDEIQISSIKKVILLVSIVLTLVSSFSNNRIHIKRVVTDYQNIYYYTESDTNHFYLFSTGTLVEYIAVPNLLLSKYYWNTSNTFYLTQFPISPHEKSKLETYMIENIWSDCVDSKTIRIVDISNIDLMVEYIREHYCSTARAELVDVVNIFKIYRIIS